MFSRTKLVALVIVYLGSACLGSVAAAQTSDEQLAARVIAARVLGPQWKQISRTAGMVFAGTVLAIETQTPKDQAVPVIRLRFRVDRAIAGVEQGQVLTVHEWAGAWSTHRPMHSGQRWLLFLYPPSRLGLTSPVGGALGQVALDASGKNVAAHALQAAGGLGVTTSSELGAARSWTGETPVPLGLGRTASPSLHRFESDRLESVSVLQLERAIRSAREE